MSAKLSRRAYIAYGAVVTCLFVLVLLPYEKIAYRVLEVVDPEGKVQVQFDSIGLAFPLGFSARGVSIAVPPRVPTLHFDRVVIRPSWSIFRLRPGVSFKASGYGGTLKGDLSKDGSAQELELEWTDLAVAEMPLPPPFRERFAGAVSGSTELYLRPPPAFLIEGYVQLRAEGLKIQNLDLAVTQIPTADLGTLSVQLGFEKAQIRVHEAFLQGKDLNAFAEGTVLLQMPLMSSPLQAQVTFKPMGDLLPRVKPLLAGLLKEDSEGQYHLRLAGSLGAPLPKI